MTKEEYIAHMTNPANICKCEGCPGIIWHDGKWCAPLDQLEFRDNAVWCKTVFADD